MKDLLDHKYINDFYNFLVDSDITITMRTYVKKQKLIIKDTSRFSLKLFVSIAFICIYVMLNDVFVQQDFKKDLQCFDDKMFTFTKDINRYITSNSILHDGYLITAGFLMDCAIFLGFAYFALVFKSWRMIISLGTLYLVRGFIQETYVMGHPEEYSFHYPGIISVSVPYFKTHDYFFSGHVSLPLIIGVEFFKNKYNKLSFFCFFVACYEMVMMIILRGHYSIDLYAGFIFSFYFCRISEYVVPYVDSFLNGDDDDHKNADSKIKNGRSDLITKHKKRKTNEMTSYKLTKETQEEIVKEEPYGSKKSKRRTTL